MCLPACLPEQAPTDSLEKNSLQTNMMLKNNDNDFVFDFF